MLKIGKTINKRCLFFIRDVMSKKSRGKNRGRRDRLYIIAELLRIAKKRSLKTQLMYGANLSFAQLKDYLSFLISTELLKIVKNDGRAFYEITLKGQDFLINYEKISLLLNK